MSDGPPTEDRAVSSFLDYIALACIFGCVEAVISSKLWAAVGAFVAALLFHTIGIKWPKVKTRVGRRLSSSMDRIAHDSRYRSGLTMLLVGCIGLYILFSLHSLRRDLDTYVLPRTVNKEQAATLRTVLSGSPSNVPVTVFTNVGDPEALEYASQLYTAITASGWEARFMPINPWEPKPPALLSKEFDYAFLMVDKGILIRTCLVGQPINPDPKHPVPDVALNAALTQANIETSGGGSTSNCEDYSLSLEVARRPEAIGQQPSLLSRLGRWLMGFSQ
jgi:hypothetical protein